MANGNEIRDAAVHFEAVKTSMSQSKQGTILRLALHPNEVPPSLHTDWVGSRYMVAMVRLDDNEQPILNEYGNYGENNPPVNKTDRLIASAGMLCRNDQFAEFLHERGYMEDTAYIESAFGEREQVCVDTIRGLLGIQSRSELRTNSQARDQFQSLSDEFIRWKQGRAS